MELFKIENLSFTYPNKSYKALSDITFNVNQGDFVVICGKSGCGKTTLLKLLKPSLSPFGNQEGNIYFKGKSVKDCDLKEQAEKIGFVSQSPDNQTVTDKVWHELAFGLESLGYEQSKIRAKVSEMASFFGIENWFYKNVNELSGGQKQLLNLASVMAMEPEVLILDEPASQLDPIAAEEFLNIIKKINYELGTTVIITEHRLEEIFNLASNVIVMDKGKIISNTSPYDTGKFLNSINHNMFFAMPTPVRVCTEVTPDLPCPLTVKDARLWLEEYQNEHTLNVDLIPKDVTKKEDTIIEIKNAYFKYEKNSPDVIKNLNMKVNKGELFAITGGNGTGKTTALSLISGLNTLYRGNIYINGQKISEIKNLYNGLLGVLPQNPQSLFVKKTVFLDLMDALPYEKSKEEKEEKIFKIAKLLKIDHLLNSHPYDLSGGEQQRAALCKVLLNDVQILLLDEPTKGMDAYFKKEFADILSFLKSKNVTIIMVSHDIEFCAEYADRCALFFDGNITSCGTPREFFKGNSFYTTSASRMARTIIPEAILADDIIIALKGQIKKREKREVDDLFYIKPIKETKEKKPTVKKRNKLKKSTVLSFFILMLLIPLTVYFGSLYFGNRKYYFISLLIILETLIPFITVFEKRKPQARELIIISVLCTVGVIGRTAFFMLPEFKPVVAVVIISGICLGGETGFLVGAVTAFVSNFFFGQGPWTPWQMFSFGIIGFISGILFKNDFLRKNKIILCIFGFLSTFLIYGGIMNPASIIMWQSNITLNMLLSSYIVAIPFDLIHSFSTACFLWFISEPMIEKIERVKIKYGLIDRGC